MIADMHCHYPMHVLAEAPEDDRRAGVPISPNVTFEAMTDVSKRPGWLNKLRARVLRSAAAKINYRENDWRVSLKKLEDGDVRAVFSVLYEPFAEIDLDELPGSDPEQGYFGDLVAQLEKVERELERIDSKEERHEFVKDAKSLDRVTGEGKVAFMHCVEGGFHLGGDRSQIDRRVEELAKLGVVYITVAHLFWRGVAGNAPALPFLSDATYNRLFFPWRRRGLSRLGAELIAAMYKHRIMVDVSHMSQRALDDTFALLSELDAKNPKRDPLDCPVIASHAGYRFGSQAYMLSPDTIRKIAERGGVIGLILARHQLNECAGVVDPDDEKETATTVCRHIDAIRRHTPAKSNAHVAIGSDLDGFIKPTVAGIETAADLAKLKDPLEVAYGKDDAEAILSGNALHVVKRVLAARG